MLELHCSFHKDAPPADNGTYQWWKNDVLLNISSATIKYPLFDPHDAGKYQCERYDMTGSGILCGQIELTSEAEYAVFSSALLQLNNQKCAISWSL